MKSTLLLLATLLIGSTIALAADTFTKALTEAERREAGLDRLSNAQRVRLDDLVERYTSGEVNRGVTEALEIKQDKEALEDPRKGPKLVETRLIGELKGWNAGTVFRLENGQAWRLANPESFSSFSSSTNPKVELKRSRIGGYWMHIEGFPPVRVKRIE